MKRIALLIALLGIGGYIAWQGWLRPEKRACGKLADLCSAKISLDCEDALAALKKRSPDELDRFAHCVDEAKSCPEAVGCSAGSALQLGVDLAKSFGLGLQRAIEGK